ncbi:dienelactone hydrolase-related enzyme [Loktanella sp. SALINAS62]|nr:dienelactone hydrolase-related enzyme [Loktanella sp. SALINAS62]
MYHKWLDRWDEQRAQRGDAAKQPTILTLDAQLAFPAADRAANIADFCALADRAVADPIFFHAPSESNRVYDRQDGWIEFQSPILNKTDPNDIVRAQVTESRSNDHALVIFHHWNASSRSRQIARFFSSQGFTVVQIAMPYHLERSRPAASHADDMLSPNLGRTIRSMRQAVLDGRKLVQILKNEGYGQVSVLGMSLGSWVAGLVAAHDQTVKKAALFLTAGSLADMVWTGRATQHIRASLEHEIDLPQLRRAWSPLNLENYAGKLARPDLDLQIVLAKRDTVVLPELSHQLVAQLKGSGARHRVLELNCGHYSLSLPPQIMWAGFSVTRLLTGNGR